MTPADLATAGRTLYGERWQTSLAQDLHVADRTMRRWLAGEFPIPAGVEEDLRKVLVARLNEIGGLIAYSVNLAGGLVVHNPTAACFQCDNAGGLKLLNPQTVAPDEIALVSRGAEEALRRERERDPRIKLTWLERVRRPGAWEQLHGFLRGSVVIPPEIDLTAPIAEEDFTAEEGEIHQ